MQINIHQNQPANSVSEVIRAALIVIPILFFQLLILSEPKKKPIEDKPEGSGTSLKDHSGSGFGDYVWDASGSGEGSWDSSSSGESCIVSNFLTNLYFLVLGVLSPG